MSDFLDLLSRYQAFALLVLSTIGGWFVWSLKNTFATKQDLAAQTEINTQQRGVMVGKFDDLRLRVDKVEASLSHLATRDDIHRVEKLYTELVGLLKGFSGQLDRIEQRVGRHEDIFTDAARSRKS